VAVVAVATVAVVAVATVAVVQGREVHGCRVTGAVCACTCALHRQTGSVWTTVWTVMTVPAKEKEKKKKKGR